MGLYDDEEIMGAEEAHAEKQRRLTPKVNEIIEKLRELEPLVVNARTPHARSEAMKPLADALEQAVAKAGPLTGDNVGLVETARSIVRKAQEDEVAAVSQRSMDELALLAEQLQLREQEVAQARSLRSVAELHLSTIAARLAELAEGGLPAAIALITRAEKAKAAIQDAPTAHEGPGPSWAQVEGAVTLWIANTWHEKVIRVEREEPGMSAGLVPGVSVHEVLAKVAVVARMGATVHRVRVGLATTDGGWAVKTLSVRA